MRAAIDDAFHDHPKVLALLNLGPDGGAALGLWTLAVSWAKGQADPDRPHLAGLVPRSLVMRWCGEEGPRLAQLLVDVKPPGYEYGLWETTDDAGWWRIHEFAQHQFLAEYAAKREQAQRAARKRWGQDGPGLFDAEADAGASAGADAHADAGAMRAHVPTPNGRNATTTTTTTTTTAKAVVKHVGSGADFDAFWAVYPRKHEKARARVAYNRARNRADAATILAGAVQYRDDPNRDAQYTKHGSTWLNNDCWTDPPLPPRGGRGSQEDRMRHGLTRAAELMAAERAGQE